MTKRKMLVLMCLLAISGCAQPLGPKGQLLFAQTTFARTVNSLTVLKDKFSEKDIENIDKIIKKGDELLDEWTDSVLLGEDMPQAIETFNTIINKLIEYRSKGENDE